ncbi:SHOCT domain-containing protein [Kitasatospora indigofera]|uniref:SHOCT domain-containing protein n=1 Tax=Kitasatospora indigofera TaxID=67307 RepID=UPI0036B40C16
MDTLLAGVTPAATALADHGWAGPGPWILLFPLFWIVVVLLVVLVLRRAVRGRGWAGRPDSPLAVLGRRYAEGAIDAEEYRARRAVLTEDPRELRGGAE